MMNMNSYLLTKTSLTKADIDDMLFHEYQEIFRILQKQEKEAQGDN